MFVTKKQLIAFEPNIEPYADYILARAVKFGLINELRLAHFLAQTCYESKRYTDLEDKFNYTATGLMNRFPTKFPNKEIAEKYAKKPEKIASLVYQGVRGNKQESSEDGWKFRGRGLLRVLGRDHYEAASQFLYNDARAVKVPNHFSRGDGAVDAALWNWDLKYLNKLADADDTVAICRKISGSTHSLNEAEAYVKQAKKAFNSPTS